MARDFYGGKARRKALLGIHLSRETATQTSGDNELFNIVDGKVLLTSVVGEITTAIGGANATKLMANPTLSTAIDTDLCATTDIDDCDVGDVLSITGLPSDSLFSEHKGAVPTMLGKGVVLQTGTLDLNCATTVDGSIKWLVTYIPLDADAYMTVA